MVKEIGTSSTAEFIIVINQVVQSPEEVLPTVGRPTLQRMRGEVITEVVQETENAGQDGG